MLKRKDPPTSAAGTTKKKETDKSTVQSYLTSWVKPTVETPTDKTSVTLDSLAAGLDDNTKKLLKLEADTMNKEWLLALKAEFKKNYFLELKKFLATDAKSFKIFPPAEDIYSWSRFTPVSKVKVVILGQDPYHNEGQAHGLCFSVRHGVAPPPSLINIYKGIKTDIPTFRVPKHGCLENWAKNGVLLLNASLTVRAHAASSHSKHGWEEFTDAVVNYLSERKSGLVFMLWGGHAQKKGKRIDKRKHLVLNAVHPSPLSARGGFFECRHWSQANAYLKSLGKETINWDCLVDDNNDVGNLDIEQMPLEEKDDGVLETVSADDENAVEQVPTEEDQAVMQETASNDAVEQVAVN
ncbi:11234_t:CDS:2 [Paraglomus occultum]|uniref:Uracil-DNA glycosylase n=1 Tax=Paraglomus occultum TaxID=144539 RepID=A0A9N9FCW1_9GLOM|nr:11234_t:CDS:2 [Paraglomus occultum]